MFLGFERGFDVKFADLVDQPPVEINEESTIEAACEVVQHANGCELNYKD